MQHGDFEVSGVMRQFPTFPGKNKHRSECPHLAKKEEKYFDQKYKDKEN